MIPFLCSNTNINIVTSFCIMSIKHADGEGPALDETALLGQDLYRWSYYSSAKVIGEKMAWKRHNEGRIVATVIRPGWLYVPRDRASIGRFLSAIDVGKAVPIGDVENRINSQEK